ncbi:MAG: ATP-dependent Clp protease ATP-binding subunit [Candidatus Promineifilaceae bacterium]|nr:ATP-dependent Clp protease ATP-binding subunit [Candidatus Promineifilaceae bacterium]
MNRLNPDIPAAELARLMTAAASTMDDYGVKLLTPQLLLRAFLDEPEAVANQLLKELAAKRGFDWDDLDRRVEMMARHNPGRDAKFRFADNQGRDVPLAEEMLVVLDEGMTIAQAREEIQVNSGHALAAMAQPSVTTYAVLQRIGVTAAAVVALLGEVTTEGRPVVHDFIAAARGGEAHPFYLRQELINELLSLLALAQRRHVILVGPEGAGKRTLGYSLAQVLATDDAPLSFDSFVQISEAALLDNPLTAIRAGLRRATGGVLMVPSIDRFFGDRLRAVFPEQANRELHKALLGNEQVVIGTATPAAYERLSQERIVRQQTHRLRVPAATRAETVAMLGFHRQRLEQDYEIEVGADSLETAAQLASQYIKSAALPAAAVQLLDRACAMVSMVARGHALSLPDVAGDGRLSSEDVMVAASLMTKIPVAKLSQDEQSRYANMVEHLHKRIIGQEEAILAVSRAVKTARVGLRDPKRPIGSFLFLGPSGVGKTELGKALAEFLFGTDDAMLTLDMSEYQEEASVNRLIGAPPGYVGYEGGGQLTDYVRQNPYTVVLLDEVEKAHPRVLDVLLQVMDEGRLTDGQGRLTTFSETVIIMTSNLGAYHMLTPIIGERERELVMTEVRRFFRPEFLNRLDEVILFHQLTGEQLAAILDLMLAKEFRLAQQQGLALSVSERAKSWLLAQNDQPEFGARPLRRIIARHLREPLADFLLRQSTDEDRRVLVDHEGSGLTFQIDAPAASTST